jgi:phenylalanyl-tRNA synthetase beta chain
MKLSFQWISDYVDLHDLTPETLADKLTGAGLEVEAITPRNQGVSGVVVGEVVACEPHPNADRLRVCQVNVGDGPLRTIVCGAPNVAVGQKVPTALPGAKLPGGSIGVAKLRGIESYGMLCSAKEIGLETKLLPKEQTEGLYVLPADAPVGADIVEYLGLDDVVLEIGLTPNRSDCLSIRGFAYEIAALLDRPTTFPEDVSPETSGASPVQVRIDTPLCQRYEAQAFTGVRTGPSPLWMQMRLMAMGIRPISLPVDITNYVMLEWGQPLHAFDLDEVHEHTIVVRQGRSDETLVTLDGESRELTEDTIVIADPDRAIGIAGVMGGQNSEITAQTKAVVLESAAFDAISVRKTGQRLGLRSEAQQRFEKGIDPQAVTGAIVRATQLFRDLAGAEAWGGVVRATFHDAYAQPTGTVVEFSPERCNRLLGTQHSEETMRDVFRRLGFTVESTEGQVWRVHVPPRRPDISLEADLVEEVGRLAGYDRIPTTLPVGPVTVGARNASQTLRKRTRDVLMSCGMSEVVTYALTHPSDLDKLRVSPDSPYRQMIPLLHPMSEERVALRTHLLPSLAQVAAFNMAHGVDGGAIFEIGRVYWPTKLPLEEQPCERTQWAGLWFGETEPGIGERARPYDFYDAKGVVETWLQALGWQDEVRFAPVQLSWLHPGRSAEVVLNGQRIGSIGELHPETGAAFDLHRAVYAEFDLDVLVSFLQTSWKVHRMPKFPASRRDLAVLVTKDVPVQALLDTAREVAACDEESILEDCRIFDIYTGKGIADGYKSVAVAFRYRADDRTLTDDEVVRVEQRILDAWTKKYGAVLRTN